MEKALLIVNPKAGRMTLKNKLFDVISVLSQKYLVTVQPTQYAGHATSLARDAQQNGYDVVVCAGGDGTLNETVTGLMQQENPLPLGYLPSGSTNDFAAGLGLSKNPLAAAQQIVDGTPHYQDIGVFNNDKNFTYIASFGAFTETSYSTSPTLKHMLGHMAYLLSGVKSLARIKAIPMKVIFDGRQEEGEYIFGCIANATSIGGVLHLKDEKLDFSDGLFEILLVRKPKNSLQLSSIVTKLLRYEYDGKLVQLHQAARVECLFDGSLSWSLDGEESVSRNHAVVEVRHHGVQFIY